MNRPFVQYPDTISELGILFWVPFLLPFSKLPFFLPFCKVPFFMTFYLPFSKVPFLLPFSKVPFLLPFSKVPFYLPFSKVPFLLPFSKVPFFLPFLLPKLWQQKNWLSPKNGTLENGCQSLAGRWTDPNTNFIAGSNAIHSRNPVRSVLRLLGC